MNEYIIYCTEEQVKKALELGAPLKDIPMFKYGDNSVPKIVHKNEWNIDAFCYCPTAEQMLGWLEAKGILVNIIYGYDETNMWVYDIYAKRFLKFSDDLFTSRQKATLAAIDVALNYLHEDNN